MPSPPSSAEDPEDGRGTNEYVNFEGSERAPSLARGGLIRDKFYLAPSRPPSRDLPLPNGAGYSSPGAPGWEGVFEYPTLIKEC